MKKSILLCSILGFNLYAGSDFTALDERPLSTKIEILKTLLLKEYQTNKDFSYLSKRKVYNIKYYSNKKEQRPYNRIVFGSSSMKKEKAMQSKGILYTVAFDKENKIINYKLRTNILNQKLEIVKSLYQTTYLDEKQREILSLYNDKQYSKKKFNDKKNTVVEINYFNHISDTKQYTIKSYYIDEGNNMNHDTYSFDKKTGKYISSFDFYEQLKKNRSLQELNILLDKEKNYDRLNMKIKYYQNFQSFGNKLSKIKFINPIVKNLDNTYIKVFFKNNRPIKAQWINNNILEIDIQFDHKGRINKITNFLTKNLINYQYEKDKILKLTCYPYSFQKGECSLSEINQFELQ
ncbi:MAG TPA: hypothetical protein ENK66_03470 [Arcobacter sp.]|nr:hypothetical protein [Arcobacter sp.]